MNYFQNPVGFGGVTGGAAAAQIDIAPRYAADIGLIIRGSHTATQTGNLMEIYDSGGNKDFYMTAAGAITVADLTATALATSGLTVSGSLQCTDLYVTSDINIGGSVLVDWDVISTLHVHGDVTFDADLTLSGSVGALKGTSTATFAGDITTATSATADNLVAADKIYAGGVVTTGDALVVAGTVTGVTNLTASGSLVAADVEVSSDVTIAGDMTLSGSVGALKGTSTATFAGLITGEGDSICIAGTQTPANASADGTVGEIAWDSNYIYVCVKATEAKWCRAAITKW